MDWGNGDVDIDVSSKSEAKGQIHQLIKLAMSVPHHTSDFLRTGLRCSEEGIANILAERECEIIAAAETVQALPGVVSFPP